MHQFLVQTRGHTLHGMIWTCTVQSDPPTFRGRILPCSQPQAWWQGRRDKPTALTWVALSELPWALWMLDSRFLFKVRLQSVPFINWTVFFLPQDLTWSYCFSSPKVKLRKSLHPATKNITLSAGNEARFWTHFMHLFIWASSFSRTVLCVGEEHSTVWILVRPTRRKSRCYGNFDLILLTEKHLPGKALKGVSEWRE